MEAAAPGEDGRTEDAAGEGREDLSLGFGYYASPRLHHQQHYHRLSRSDAFPFRVASSCHAAAGASTASDGRAGPPPSPRTLASLPSSGVGGGGGVTAALGHGGISDSDSYGTPTALRPVNSPGLAGDATLQLCSSFTADQWQELHRQALIFKCIVTSTPVPTDLLTHSRFPDGHPFFSNLSRGGDYLNLRFTGANGDLEPGRCRRTDGKKWRCSRDVAPGQKYCERHVHRARPRSRKPVEVLDGRADPAAAANNSAETTVSTSKNHGAPSTSTAKPAAAARPSAQSPPGLPAAASGGDVKFPFQFMVPEDKKLRYLGSYGGVHAEPQPATQQWQRPHSKMGLQHNGDNRLNLRCSSLNDDHHGCPFPSTTLISATDTDPHDRRDTQRCFIDAWSRSENPFDGVTIGDGYKTNSGDGASSCVRSLENLSPSSLTLSMSGTGDGGGEHHDHIQMGMRSTDSGKMLGPSWMSPVSPIGGPLAEVLQTSSTVSFRNERAGHENDAAAARGSGGLIDLMCKTSCDSEGTSPRRGFSSPTRVLQKALVSLSDSSSNSNSSTTFGPGRRPAELGLQWGSPFN